MTEQWLLKPPLPGEHLVRQSVTLAGSPVQVAVHEELLGEIRHLVPLLESAASEFDEVVGGTELSVPWGDVRVVERDGDLIASTQDSRSVVQIKKDRCHDVSQLVWVHKSWRQVRSWVGLSDDLSSVDVRQLSTWVYVSKNLLVDTKPVEARHVGDEMVRWFVGERPFDERMITHLAASMKFAGNVFTHRPELVPAYCVPLGYRVFADADRGITEIRDDSDAVVFSA